MAPSPLLLDQLSIAPGEAGTRTIQRDAAAGALSFTDPVSGTLLLSQLANLSNIGGVLLVGRSGAGAQYTAIQDALDAVPSTASQTNPYLVLVMPGAYSEELVLDKNGVILFGLGGVRVTPTVDDNTLTIQAGAGTTPQWVEVHGLTLTNAYTNKGCVRVIGGAASNVGRAGISFYDCRFEAGAAGGNRAVWATSCGPLWFNGCTFSDGGLALILMQEVMGFHFDNSWLPALSYRYDTGEDLPAGTYAGFRLLGCQVGSSSTLDPVLDIELVGAGSGIVQGNVVTGNSRVQGNRPLSLTGNTLTGDFTVTDTAQVQLDLPPTGTETIAVGATYSTAWRSNTEALVATATQAVAFGFDYGTTEYDVLWELDARPVNDETPWITAKLVTGFTINFNTAQTLGLSWAVRRR